MTALVAWLVVATLVQAAVLAWVLRRLRRLEAQHRPLRPGFRRPEIVR